MRIALLSYHTCPLARLGGRFSGGLNVYVRESARELVRQGFTVDIFTAAHRGQGEQVSQLGPGLRLIHLPVDGAPAGEVSRAALYGAYRAFAGRIHRFARSRGLAYDLVHAHYWLSGLVGLELKRAWRVPLVAMFHTLALVKHQARVGEGEPPERVEAEGRIIAGADAVVAATDQEKNLLVRLYGAPAHRVAVIPCGVNLRLFRPRDPLLARRRLGLPPDKRLVLYVGRLDPLKGLDLLLRALARLEDRGGVQLIVIGGDRSPTGERRRLESLARELGLGGTVRFVGPVAHAQLPWYFSAAAVTVVPSYHESFGLVALESLACGTPVIAARVGGLTRTVVDGLNGYLVAWHCPEAFTERLELVLGNEGLRRRLAAAARASVQAFTWPEVTRRLANLYATLAAGPAGARATHLSG